jgi:hypothetical protein
VERPVWPSFGFNVHHAFTRPRAVGEPVVEFRDIGKRFPFPTYYPSSLWGAKSNFRIITPSFFPEKRTPRPPTLVLWRLDSIIRIRELDAVVGGHLFGLLALVHASFSTRSSAQPLEAVNGGIPWHANLLPLDFVSIRFVSRHSVTGTTQHTTKYANYANYPFPPERASVPATRGKEILCSPYCLLNLTLSPLSQINSYPRKTSHPPVS